MSLKLLLSKGRLKHHKTSVKEVSNLIRLIERDIKDAKIKGLSCDRKFTTAYNAGLQTAMIFLYCEGYKTKGIGHHSTVFQAMKEIMGRSYFELADYFDSCRVKRNLTAYTYAGEVSESEAVELGREAEEFLKVLINWLKKNHPELLAKTDSE